MSHIARLDLHCHTQHSGDCFVPLEQLVRTAAARGLTHLAITDHDSCQCARHNAGRSWAVELIFGEEVTLANGTHLIALGIRDEIQSKTLAEALREVREAGGLVVVPHPFKKGSGIFSRPDEELFEVRELVAAHADAIEVCNSKLSEEENRRAFELARQLGKAMTAGSDAHFGSDVGDAVLETAGAGDWRALIGRGNGRVMINRHVRQGLFDVHLVDERVSNLAPSLRRWVPKPLRTVLKRTLHRALYQPRVRRRAYELEELWHDLRRQD